MLPPGYPWVPLKMSAHSVQAVWAAIGNIYTNVLFYYIDDLRINKDFLLQGTLVPKLISPVFSKRTEYSPLFLIF